MSHPPVRHTFIDYHEKATPKRNKTEPAPQLSIDIPVDVDPSDSGDSLPTPATPENWPKAVRSSGSPILRTGSFPVSKTFIHYHEQPTIQRNITDPLPRRGDGSPMVRPSNPGGIDPAYTGNGNGVSNDSRDLARETVGSSGSPILQHGRDQHREHAVRRPPHDDSEPISPKRCRADTAPPMAGLTLFPVTPDSGDPWFDPGSISNYPGDSNQFGHPTDTGDSCGNLGDAGDSKNSGDFGDRTGTTPESDKIKSNFHKRRFEQKKLSIVVNEQTRLGLFDITIHAGNGSDGRKTMTFQASGGKGTISVKCRSGNLGRCKITVSLGNGFASSTTHDFADEGSLLCSLPGLFDFMDAVDTTTKSVAVECAVERLV